MSDQSIYDKLEILYQEALERGENNVVIILCAFLGAVEARKDGLLASHVQDFVRTVLTPMVKEQQSNLKISFN